MPSFEKVVDSLYVKPDVDIYITGSNAYMLSGDLATLLSGRYVEIKMHPLSFREFLSVSNMEPDKSFAEYMKTGGLPYLAVMDRTPKKVETYLEGIYNTVIVRDIEDRQARREADPSKRKITDVALLKTIAKYLASVVGSPCIYSQHHRLPDLQWTKGVGEYRQRLCGGANGILHLLSGGAL